MTGATGFIGSHIAGELLGRGYRVLLLARPDKQMSARERIRQVLTWGGLNPEECDRLEVIEGFIDRPRLGLARRRYSELAETIDEVIHCASNTSFSERKRKAVEQANITGLRHLLELAVRSTCYFFHHMSTAYVAGKKSGPCPEEFIETTAFTNVYEETKYAGEQIIRKTCGDQGIRLNVYRPSIVYGSSKDGRSLRFNALYYPLRTILFLKNLFLKDIQEADGRRAARMGAAMGPDGKLHLPIRIEAGNGNGINLVPVDFLVSAFMEIMDTCLEGGVFHIVNQRATPIEELAGYARRYFNITGLHAAQAEALSEKPKSALDILFDNYTEAYKPYMTDARLFRTDKTRPLLEKKQITCPDLDYDLFSKCMSYAIEKGWGSSLFEN